MSRPILALCALLSICSSCCASKCDDGWLESSAACYLINDEKLEYDAAENKCKAAGGFLAKLDGQNVIDFLKSKITEIRTSKGITENQSWFIGLKDKNRNQPSDPLAGRKWKWADNSAAKDILWFKGDGNIPAQPNKGTSECGMIAVNFNFLIGDRDCDRALGYICQAELKEEEEEGDPLVWGSKKKPNKKVYTSEDDYIVIPNPDKPIRVNGKVSRWYYYASSDAELEFYIYRPTQMALMYEMVDKVTLRPSAKRGIPGNQASKNKAEYQLTVRAGDLIGVKGTLNYTGSRCNEEEKFAMFTSPETGIKPEKGFIQPFLRVRWNPKCRRYPIKVEFTEQAPTTPGLKAWPMIFHGMSPIPRSKRNDYSREGDIIIPNPEMPFTTNRLLTEFRFYSTYVDTTSVDFELGERADGAHLRLLVLRPVGDIWSQTYKVVHVTNYRHKTTGLIKVPIEPPFPANKHDVIGVFSDDNYYITYDPASGNCADEDKPLIKELYSWYYRPPKVKVDDKYTFSYLRSEVCRKMSIGVMWQPR